MSHPLLCVCGVCSACTTSTAVGTLRDRASESHTDCHHTRAPPTYGVLIIVLCVLCPFSGYYIFNEPLKRAVMEVKAKEARDRAAAGGGSASNGSASRSSSDVGSGNQAPTAAANPGNGR